MKNIGAKFDMGFDWLRSISFIFYCLAIVTVLLKSPQNLVAKEVEQFNRDLKNYNVKLQILNKNKRPIAKFATAIADDDDKKRFGLMDLDSLPQNQAMLFVFDNSEVISMWMKNTRIPLDMIFIDKDNRIINIKSNIEPFSLEIISSEKPVNKVLEIDGGLSKKLGIKVGQEIMVNIPD